MKVKIERLNDQGQGICYVDNKITFISNVVPYDICDIDIIKEYKKYNIGKLNYIIRKSYIRNKSICKYSDKCGGCSLSCLTYNDTIEYKKNRIKNILKKFNNIDIDVNVIESRNKYNYRNKITLHIKDNIIGYYKEDSNELIEVDYCNIASKSINEFIKYIKYYGIRNGKVIIRSNFNDNLIINFISNDKINIIKNNLKITGILHNNKLIYGEDFFCESINNMNFKVSYNSFFQVNRDILKEIFNLLNKYILIDSVVLDLYCGVGVLGQSIAKKVKKVYGIEIVENAIINANYNAVLNNLNNCFYLLGDVSLQIDKIKDNIDSIILDPPRAGLDKHTIEVINKIKPKQIIYISCDTFTFARDLKLLDNYFIEYITGLDMFCYTYHVECVAVLQQNM